MVRFAQNNVGGGGPQKNLQISLADCYGLQRLMGSLAFVPFPHLRCKRRPGLVLTWLDQTHIAQFSFMNIKLCEGLFKSCIR